MARLLLRSTAAAALLALGAVLAPGSASAATPDPGAFGQHAADCARVTGFDRHHNPGMHQGISGWDPSHTC